MRELYFQLLAPAAAASFFWLVASVVALSLRYGGRDRLRWGATLATAATFTALVFIVCPPSFRVLYDETSFLNTAQALLTTGKAGRGQEWIWAGGVLAPLENVAPFRSALYPTLVAIAGLWSRPEPWHGFLVNFLATSALLAILISRAADAGEAALKCALTGGSAVFCLTASSSGYDLLSLALGLLTWTLMTDYATSRRLATLSALLGAGLAFAHTRNEGILAFLILWAWLLRSEWKALDRRHVLLLLAPFLLAPVVAQRVAFYPHVELNGIEELVSATQIPGHLVELVRAFFLEPSGPFPVLAHWLGVAVLIRFRERLRAGTLPVLMFLGLLLVFLLAFHDGGARHPFQARLFLPFSLALCLVAAMAWKKGTYWRRTAAVVAAVQLAVCFPHLRAGYAFFRHPIIDEVEAIKALVEKSPSKAMFVYFSSGVVAAFGRASVRPATFERDRAFFDQMMKKESAGPLYLLESWPPHKGTIATKLSDGEAKTIAEVPLRGLRYLRLLEITSRGAIRGRAPE